MTKEMIRFTLTKTREALSESTEARAMQREDSDARERVLVKRMARAAAQFASKSAALQARYRSAERRRSRRSSEESLTDTKKSAFGHN